MGNERICLLSYPCADVNCRCVCWVPSLLTVLFLGHTHSLKISMGRPIGHSAYHCPGRLEASGSAEPSHSPSFPCLGHSFSTSRTVVTPLGGGAVYAKAIIAMSGPINHRSDHQHKPVPLPLTATNLHIDSVDVMTGTTPIYVMGKLRCGE